MELNDSPVLTTEGLKNLEQKILENKNTEPAPSIKQDASKEETKETEFVSIDQNIMDLGK